MVEDSCQNRVMQNLKMDRMVLLYENQDELMKKLNLAAQIIQWEREQAGLKANEFAEVNEILKVQPDVVIGLSDHIDERACKVSKKLSEHGIQPILMEYKNVQQLKESVHKLGLLTGRTMEAKQWGDEVDNSLEQVKTAIAKSPVKKVYWEFDFKPNQIESGMDQGLTLAGTHLLNELLTFAGGTNIAEKERVEPTSSYAAMKEVEIMEANPDILFIPVGSSNLFSYTRPEKRRNWDKIEAVKENRLYEVNPETYDIGRLPETIVWLATHMHPDAF
ncbi:ABC transporter substrate-binding protein [Paenibacillus lutrae]|nr:ABC transporter substrate-binding protein [Paenibacillus lutrae]